MRAVLCFLLALLAAPAWAELVKVSATEVMVVYIDEATIRKDKHLRWVWAVLDYRQRRDDGLMSRRVLGEFDCTAEKLRILSMFNHSQPMAGGPAKLVGNDPAILTDVADSAPAAAILKIVCAR
jgi:hypothetical protein